MNTRILLLIFLCLIPFNATSHEIEQTRSHPMRSVLICPTGDIKHRGRTIYGSTEAALTFSCATTLQAALMQQEICNALVSRAAGQPCEPLHNAQYANRLNAQLCIILSFFESPNPEPVIYLYHGVYDNKPTRSMKTFTFHPVQQAYVINRTRTVTYSTHLYTALAQAPAPLPYIVHAPQGIRHQAVTGIISPTIIIEIGLPAQDSWHQLIQPLTNAIHLLVNSINEMRAV